LRARVVVPWLVLLWVAVALVGCGGADDGGSGAGSSAAASSSPAASDPAEQGTVVLDQDFPDPDVLRVEDTFYAYATQPGDGSANISMATSTDLRSWEPAVMDPLPELPSWATTGRTWAPDVSEVRGGFVMYFTAHSIDPDLQCIGVARSEQATGPFRPAGERPLICPAGRGGAIDAASFVDDDGKRYLLWKNDGNCCGKDTWLHIQPVSPDGLRLTGPPTRLVRQTEPWEGDLVEAPTLVRAGDTYVLLYSANDYSGDQYATGYATSDRLLGPYRKAEGPLLTTEATGVSGPGGQDVVVGDDDRTYIAFHAWDDAHVARYLHVMGLDLTDPRALTTR
jgi:beta-xylosidase